MAKENKRNGARKERKGADILDRQPPYNAEAEMAVLGSILLKPDACDELDRLLAELKVDRLAVGHTPGPNVRSSCADRFWAVDSLLGRWIRTSGNMYCAPKRRVSQNGRFACGDLTPTCMGQVVKVTKSKGVEIIA